MYNIATSYLHFNKNWDDRL